MCSDCCFGHCAYAGLMAYLNTSIAGLEYWRLAFSFYIRPFYAALE